jgi:hypothetical protein
VEIAGRRAATDLRNNHDGREPAAFRYPRSHASDHRTEGLARPLAEDALRVWPIGKAVGNVRNDGPTLLEPTTVAEPTLL